MVWSIGISFLMVWSIGISFGHINKVKLRRARLVLGLLNTLGGSTIPVFSRLLRPLSLTTGRCYEYWRWFRPPLGRNALYCRSLSLQNDHILFLCVYFC